jgi:hypothetical protein
MSIPPDQKQPRLGDGKDLMPLGPTNNIIHTGSQTLWSSARCKESNAAEQKKSREREREREKVVKRPSALRVLLCTCDIRPKGLWRASFI